jgi:hypothetical protein
VDRSVQSFLNADRCEHYGFLRAGDLGWAWLSSRKEGKGEMIRQSPREAGGQKDSVAIRLYDHAWNRSDLVMVDQRSAKTVCIGRKPGDRGVALNVIKVHKYKIS